MLVPDPDDISFGHNPIFQKSKNGQHVPNMHPKCTRIKHAVHVDYLVRWADFTYKKEANPLNEQIHQFLEY